MIGLVCGEDWTAIEFRPIFASRSMKWATLCINRALPDRFWGEWGIAFTNRGKVCVFKGDEMHFVDPLRVLKKFLGRCSE